jgi:hypothetical protein
LTSSWFRSSCGGEILLRFLLLIGCKQFVAGKVGKQASKQQADKYTTGKQASYKLQITVPGIGR